MSIIRYCGFRLDLRWDGQPGIPLCCTWSQGRSCCCSRWIRRWDAPLGLHMEKACATHDHMREVEHCAGWDFFTIRLISQLEGQQSAPLGGRVDFGRELCSLPMGIKRSRWVHLKERSKILTGRGEVGAGSCRRRWWTLDAWVSARQDGGSGLRGSFSGEDSPFSLFF